MLGAPRSRLQTLTTSSAERLNFVVRQQMIARFGAG
jgi:hypothetical protein